MELKRTEQETKEMSILYESLRRSEYWISSSSKSLPPLKVPDNHTIREALNDDQTYAKFSSEEELLTHLQALHSQLQALETRMQKFQKNLDYKDPVSGNPRYGEKSAERVRNLLALYESLQAAVGAAFGVEAPDGDNAPPTTTNTANDSIVSQLQSAVESQHEALRRAKEQQEERQRLAQEAQEASLREQQQKEEQRRQQAEEARRKEEADIARRAQALREAQQQAEQAAAQAERDWVDSIEKGPNGVKQQIQRIKDDTASDPAAQKTALTALLTIFTQISQHPEEINFRRIRRDHPKFVEEIGRHQGGREVLVAAGFRFVTLDDVPCFFSKEPDLETDMDGWSAWFDNLKANLEVIKEMQ